jgi:hypothetical protein
LSTGKRILERVLDDNPKTSSEKSMLEYLEIRCGEGNGFLA